MTPGLQPFLTGATVTFQAPTQVWSGADGDIGENPIDGIYHGDQRFVNSLRVTVGDGNTPEWVASSSPSASTLTSVAMLRDVDDATPDPKVRLCRRRDVRSGGVSETYTLESHLDHALELTLQLRIRADATALQEIKAGQAARDTVEWAPATTTPEICALTAKTRSVLTMAGEPAVFVDGSEAVIVWTLACPSRGSAEASWALTVHDSAMVVDGANTAPPWRVPEPDFATPSVHRWLDRALSDLSALRMTLPNSDDAFYAAGLPWFFTLFGRDSLWTSRLMLPLDVTMAASTLRVLAGLQGTTTDRDRAEQPGKILHEMRSGTLTLPGEGITLPPVYYGTVDATPLWVCLLVDASHAGMPREEVKALLPHLQRAMEWIMVSTGDGFLDYIDESGHGLSNQGWKDSGDSIQWRDGRLADGPIALCEVQGYAHEAAMGAADLYDEFGAGDSSALRLWAGALKHRFRERFWVTTVEGTYPAIALDRYGNAVDSLTSNIGHLLGTGILDEDEELAVADLIRSSSLSSGWGVRTMSTGALGYWPLSYHGGSVWPHDTAIIARGMTRAGLHTHARAVTSELVAAAEQFDFRVPELFSGDARAERVPIPYPASCRPQAWSAASAAVAWSVFAGEPDLD